MHTFPIGEKMTYVYVTGKKFEDIDKMLYCADLKYYIRRKLESKEDLLNAELMIKKLIAECNDVESAKQFIVKLAMLVDVEVRDPIADLPRIHDKLLIMYLPKRLSVDDNIPEYCDLETDNAVALIKSVALLWLQYAKRLQRCYASADRGSQYAVFNDNSVLLNLGEHKAEIKAEDSRILLIYRDHSRSRVEALTKALEQNNVVSEFVEKASKTIIAVVNTKPESLKCLAVILANTTSLDIQEAYYDLIKYGCRPREC